MTEQHRQIDLTSLIFGATMGACFAEATTAATGALQSGGDLFGAIAAFFAGFAVFGAAALPISLVLDWMIKRPSSTAAANGVRAALGGKKRSAGLAGTLMLFVLVGAFAVTVPAGEALSNAMTARFASVLIAGVFAGTAAGLFTGAGLAAGPISIGITAMNRRLPRVAKRVPLLTAAGVTAAVGGVTARLLPLEWVFAPTAAAATVLLLTFEKPQRFVVSFFARRAVRIALFVLPVLFFIASLFMEALPASARLALLYRAPYAATLLGIGQQLWDRDNDGYSPFFLGGDCNDSARRVNPEARDIPGNDIDENCSGRDAGIYRPQVKADYRRPRTLPDKTNMVFIMLDALRPDHLEMNGYKRPTSKRLEKFAKRALYFPRAYTPCPRTEAVLTTIFTGKDPRIPRSTRRGNNQRLDERTVTVAEQLKRRKYNTVGYSISYIIQHHFGIGQGFRKWKTPWKPEDWRKVYYDAADRTNKAALKTLKKFPEDGSEPFFYFLHYQCTHDPYIQHDPWNFGNSELDRYDSAAAYCDDRVGKILDALDKRKDRADTAVVIFSDHGELFGEHGYKNHGNSLFETDVRVFFAADIPGVRPRRVETPVTLTDLGPTIADLSGISSQKMQGLSLLAHASPKTKLPERTLFLYTDLQRGSIKRDIEGALRFPYKLIRDRKAGTETLFNVLENPEENRNIVGRRQDVYQELAEQLESYNAFLATNKE